MRRVGSPLPAGEGVQSSNAQVRPIRKLFLHSIKELRRLTGERL